MALPIEIRQFFYETLNGDRDVFEFEKWLYTNKELEGILNSDDYLDLISHNFKRSGAKNDLSKLLEKHINKAEFEKWKLVNLLNKALARDKDLPKILMKFYDLYCHGYYFLGNLGIGYGLAVKVPYSLADSWDELTQQQQKDILDSFYPQITVEIQKVIEWLNDGTIVLTGTQNELDYYEYNDFRILKEKQPSAYKVTSSNTDREKSWWKFWQT